MNKAQTNQLERARDLMSKASDILGQMVVSSLRKKGFTQDDINLFDVYDGQVRCQRHNSLCGSMDVETFLDADKNTIEAMMIPIWLIDD